MADWELSQLAVRTPAPAPSTDYIPLLVTTDFSTPPFGAGGSDQRATIASVVNSVQAFAPQGLTGAVAVSRYVGATTSGAPVSGTFAVGDFVTDRSGTMWICTAAGSPGTWTALVNTTGAQTIGGLKTFTSDFLVNKPSSYANVALGGPGDGAQYANIDLFDGVYPLDQNPGGHYAAISFRADSPAHRVVFFSYNGAGHYTNTLQILESGALSTVAGNTLDDSGGNATLVGNLKLAAGTTSLAPLTLQTGTNLTAAAAGAAEYDGVSAYFTSETTSGRGLIPVEQRFRLTATGSTISTIANYFGANSNISLVSGGEYEIEIDCWFLKTTAGTVTWTFTNSAAPTSMTIDYQLSPATGIVTTPAATDLFGSQYNVTATAPTVVSASLTTAVNHRHRFKIRLINGTGTSLKIQATAGAGTITPGINSYWIARRVPAANVGSFAS